MKHFSILKDNRVIIGLIFALALFLRIYNLSSLPNGFYTDEVVSGYVGRFILINGEDPYGNSFPLFYFDKFGDYRVVLPMYITGLSTFVFGVNEFAVRFPPAFFGALFVIVVYFFVRELTKNKRVALATSFFSAILPWHIVLSRAQSEGIMGLTVFTYALYLLFSSLRTQKIRIFIFAIAIFALTYLFYPSFRILAPLVVAPAILFAKNWRWKRYTLFAAMALTLLSFFVYQTNWGRGRFEQTSYFSSKYVADQIQSSIDAGTSPDPSVLVARIFHNKVGGYGRDLVIRYVDYFSPQFLFLNGGFPSRYGIPNTGLVYIVFGVLFLSFAFSIKKFKDKPALLFLLILLLLSPLPSLMTTDDVPNINRALLMILPLLVICAYGAVSLLQVSKRLRNIFIVVFLIFLFGEMVYVYHQYEYHAKTVKGILRNDQYSELSKFMIFESTKRPKIYAPAFETLPIYYAFYSNNFDKSLAGKFSYGLIVDQIDNVVFIRDVCPDKIHEKSFYEKGSLIIQTNECSSNSGYRLLKTFTRHDSTEAFRVLLVD